MRLLVLLFSFLITAYAQAIPEPIFSPLDVDPRAIYATCVDLTTGAFLDVEEDLALASFRPVRTYSSHTGKWNFFPHTVLLYDNQTALTYDIDGTTLQFQNGKFTLPSFRTQYPFYEGKRKEGCYLITTSDGSVRMYEESKKVDLGPLCGSYDDLEKLAEFKHARYLRLVSETTATGKNTYSYDKNGRLSEIKLSTHKVHFSYRDDRVKVLVNDQKMVDYHFSKGRLVYVARHHKPSIQYHYHKKNIIKKELPEGHITTISYDDNGRVKALNNKYTFVYADGRVEVKNALGYLEVFSHRDRAIYEIKRNACTQWFEWTKDNPSKRLLEESQKISRNAALAKTRHHYYPDGTLKFSQFFDGPQLQAETPEYSYEKGRLIRENLGNGKTIEYCYLPKSSQVSRVLEQQDGKTIRETCIEDKLIIQKSNESVKRLFCDEWGHIIRIECGDKVEEFTYDIFGNCIKKIDPVGAIYSYTYNANNQLIEARANEKVIARHAYDIMGNEISFTDQFGQQTDFGYNKNSELISATYPAISNEKGEIVRPVEKFTYDAFGNLASKTDAKGYQELYTATSTGKYLRIEYPDQTEEKFSYQGDLLKKAQERDQTTTVYSYDKMHRLEGVEVFSSDNQLLTKQKYTSLETQDENGTYSTCERDSFGRVIKEVEFSSADRNPADPEAKKREYSYDLHNRPHRIKHWIDDSNFITEYFSYDKLDRVTEHYFEEPDGSVSHRSTFTYNPVLNLTQDSNKKFFVDLNGNTSLYLDGNLRREWHYGPMNRLEKKREGTRETQYEYGPNTKLFRIRYPDVMLTYKYNKDNSLQKIISSRSGELVETQFNNNGQLESANVAGNGKVCRVYALDGRIKEETIIDAYGSYTMKYSYDRLGRLKRVILPDNSSFEYSYRGTRPEAIVRFNKEGAAVYRHDFLSTTEQKLITRETKNLGFNAEYGLASVSTPYHAEEIMSYDANGNPLQIQRGATSCNYAYNASNELIEEPSHHYVYDDQETLLQRDGVLLPACSYDGRGNTIQYSNKTLRYNELNQPTSATVEGRTVEYRSDFYGRRIGRKEASKGASQVHRFIFIGHTEIGALDETGKLIELKIPEVIYGGNAIGAIAVEVHDKTYLPITSLSGDIVGLVDPDTRALIESYEYTAFGNRTVQPSICPWGYRGLRFDPVTEHVRFAFRDYSPDLQRFLSEDPLGMIDGANLYAYVHNNPLVYADFDGLKTSSGPCHCHGTDCMYYVNGQCGHGGDTMVDDGLLGMCKRAAGHAGTIGIACFDGYFSPMDSIAVDFLDPEIANSALFIWSRRAGTVGNVIVSALTIGTSTAITTTGSIVIKNRIKSYVKNEARKRIETVVKRQIENIGSKSSISKPRQWTRKPKPRAARKTFPQDPNDLLPDLPRDKKGRIYAADNLRIRPEKHAFKPNDTHNPRHHDQHYHVETRRNPLDTWNDYDNIHIIKPDGYQPGAGTGFLPGELFPQG